MIFIVIIFLTCASKKEQLYFKGELLYYQGDYKKAIKVFDEYLESNPNFKKSWYNWNPTIERALTAKGNAHFKLGEFNKAILAYNQSLIIAGKTIANNEANYFNRGLTQFYQGNYQAALASLDTVDNKKFGNPVTLLLKANIFTLEAKYDTALFLIEKCLELNQKNGDALIRKVDLWIKIGLLDSAMTLFNNVLGIKSEKMFSVFTEKISILNTHFIKEQMKKDSVFIYYSDANEKINNGEYEDALQVLEKALKKTHTPKLIHTKIGDVLMGLDKVDKAIELYNRSIMADSLYVDALWKKANALVRQNEITSAKVLYERVLELNHDNIFANIALKLLYSEL